MSEIQEANPHSKEEMEQSLKRLRKKMTYIKDDMQITSFAIRCIENDLQELETKDKLARESNSRKRLQNLHGAVNI
jgi:hypothetical protein